MKSFFIPHNNIYPSLIKVNFIGTSSVVLRKDSLSTDDKFFEELKKYYQDLNKGVDPNKQTATDRFAVLGRSFVASSSG